jgi:hypothetical protein
MTFSEREALHLIRAEVYKALAQMLTYKLNGFS